ncbi:hypothetical protein YOLOSWAG_2 [Erwinia phage vB_EamM_Yoloswag]|uniref:Uncharacterized protein n=1 Tax=Erwinia phage vB_EamM_Yoloswag TaxID=1958956 RepID=A0A1S6L2V0_9CAUD|nr:hypothetical protein HOR66_gp002 [Erwinia phage vB_EamM_Yoloswag]AQT28489.1 hypothetical protein YOLOSWAG_2 [Erwinia phage vB_EamM_Yoloswag]
MSEQLEWFPYDPVECVEKEIYHIRTKEGTEYSFMYPNGEGFHRQHDHALCKQLRVPKSEVTHVALHMTHDDFLDNFILGRNA